MRAWTTALLCFAALHAVVATPDGRGKNITTDGSHGRFPPLVGEPEHRKNATLDGSHNDERGPGRHFRGSHDGSHDLDVAEHGLRPEGKWNGSGSHFGPDDKHKKHHCGPCGSHNGSSFGVIHHHRHNGSFDGSHAAHEGSDWGCDGSSSSDGHVQAVNSTTTTSSVGPTRVATAAITTMTVGVMYLLN